MLILGETEVERRRREKAHQPERALELLAEMQGRGLDPDVTTYNAAISACEKGHQY